MADQGKFHLRHVGSTFNVKDFMRQYVHNLFNRMEEARFKRLKFVILLEERLYELSAAIVVEDVDLPLVFELMRSFGEELNTFESVVQEPHRQELMYSLCLRALIVDKANKSLFGQESMLPLKNGKECILSMSYIGCSLLSIRYMERIPAK